MSNRTRAIENMAYVVAANQGASLKHYPPYSWPGGSMIVDYDGRILAEGNVHDIRELIDEHPHMVHIRAADPRGIARACLQFDDVLSLTFAEGSLVVQTGRPDEFYARLTELAASEAHGPVFEVTSPDDNLQAVFSYLVK